MKKTLILIIIVILFSSICFALCEHYIPLGDCPHLSKNFDWKNVKPEAVIYYCGVTRTPHSTIHTWHKIVAEKGKAYVMLGESFPSIYPNSERYVKLSPDGDIWTLYKED